MKKVKKLFLALVATILLITSIGASGVSAASLSIGHARSSSKPSDQQVSVTSYYSGGWTVVLRPVSTTTANKMAEVCTAGCNNNNIRYSQSKRTTLYNAAQKVNYDLSKISSIVYCDCSSFMAVCAIAAGVNVSATVNTRNMKDNFVNTGKFTAISMPSTSNLKKGDILLKPGSHTAMVLGNGAATGGSSSTSQSSSVSVPSYLFDANYYSIKYSDLNKAFGYDANALYNHWLTYGKKEGRSPSPIYDPSYYVNNNSDLLKAFGYDYTALYNHFVTYGINEFRKSSPLYDGAYYKNKYSDLQKAFGSSSKSYIEHFLTYGMKEGRQANSAFNVTAYKNRYSDLQKAFGNDMKSYYYHYMEYGISEGRKAD